MRCTVADEDDITLDLVDVRDEKRRTPVLTVELLSDQRPPYCVR